MAQVDARDTYDCLYLRAKQTPQQQVVLATDGSSEGSAQVATTSRFVLNGYLKSVENATSKFSEHSLLNGHQILTREARAHM